MTIKTAALQKKKEYDDGYKKWCLENPGYVMNGLSSKSIGADLASYCDTVEDVQTLIKVYGRKAKNTDGPHGYLFITTALTEILELYNKT